MKQVPILTDIEVLILDLIITEGGEMYGWDMVEKSGGELKLGSLYTTLNRMEDKGYIKSRKEKQRQGARGLPRRMYLPTGYGKKVHAFWEMAQQEWGGNPA